MLRSPTQLHIPDGFLLLGISLVGWFLAMTMIWLSVRKTRDRFGERQTPLIAVLAAFIFAAQAINFPVAAGTSGHLLGAALSAILVGPWGAILMMTAVVSVQGLIFQDGGLVSMGWNIMNLGVLTAFSGYGIYTLLRNLLPEGWGNRIISGFTAAWVSVEVAAIATAFELHLSGTSPIRLGLPALASVYALIGLGEGILTAGAISLIQTARPELFRRDAIESSRLRILLVLGVILTLGVVSLSWVGSRMPDGLQVVAERLGFVGLTQASIYRIFPGYRIGSVANEKVALTIALVLGSVFVFGLFWFLGRSVTRRDSAGD